MEPNHFGSAKIYAFPAGGREAEKIRREETSLAAQGIATAPVGSGWYHEAAMHEDEAAGARRELPWWAEAESESRAKSVAVRLF
jgi:predicted NAD/FAD-binding protein